MTSTRRILWITTRWPLPASDGSSQASCAGIQQLSSMGERVDLFSFSKKEVSSATIETAKTTLGINEVRIALIQQKFARTSRFLNAVSSIVNPFGLPFTYIPFRDTALIALLQNDRTDAYTHIIFDGPHTAATLLGKGSGAFEHKLKYIYRAHNVESSLWFQSAKKSFWPLKLLILNQAKKVQKFEQSLLSISSAVATVSTQDLEQFGKKYSIPKSKVIPIGFDFTELPPALTEDTDKSQIKLLFLGSLSWRPNKEGLVWFLDKVWPSVSNKRNDISLIIAGRGTETLSSNFRKLPNVKFLGQVKDLNNLYSEINASIVPIFFGSGTRVKAIEAGRFQRACISTAIGIEGLPLLAGKSYLNAETAEEWILTLTELSNEKLEVLGNEAFWSLKTNFDNKRVAQDFIELLDSL